MGNPADGRKVPVVNRRDYTIYIEYISHQAGRSHWLHIDVRKWSSSVARQISADFDTLLDLHGTCFHVAVDLNNWKLSKFVDLFGFEEISRIETDSRHIMRQYVAWPGRKLNWR
jgi:hypothetical protein